jgi:hypothetical protein
VDSTVVKAKRTAWFLGVMATTVEVVGEAAMLLPWWRRSKTTLFPGAAVKAGQTARFSGVATAWRQSGWRQHRRGGGKF